MWLLRTTFWLGFVQVLVAHSLTFHPQHYHEGITSSQSQQRPDWMLKDEHKAQNQQQQQLVINDVIGLVTATQNRILQEQKCNTTEGSENPCVLQTPEQVCEKYKNGTAGIFTCTCSRYGTKDTQVDCTYDATQCNSDNTTCYTGSISQIYNSALQSRVVTTCTTFIQSFAETVPLNTELCIRVFPSEDGNYETLASCSTTLQPAGSGVGDDGKVCNSCSICPKPNTDGSSSNTTNTTTNPNISFNCCNVMTDIQQTCAPVTAKNGIAIPQYDAITPDNQGTCTSHGYSYRPTRPVTAATTMVGWIRQRLGSSTMVGMSVVVVSYLVLPL